MLPGVLCFSLLFLYPMGYTFMLSIQKSDVPWDFTLQHYTNYLTSAEGWRILSLSFGLALFPTILTILISIPFSLLIRKKLKGHRFYRLLMILPMMVPSLISTLGLMLFFNTNGWFNLFLLDVLKVSEPISINYTMRGLIIYYAWLHFPYTAISTLVAVEGMDRQAESAASVCGASPLQVFRHITLPLVMPGILSGSIMTFLLCFGTFSVPLIAGGEYRPIAVQVYTQTAVFNDWSKGSALAIIMAVIQVLLMMIYLKISKKRVVK